MVRIATFNVNSVRARLPNVCDWLKETAPDVALLQEIKCQDEQFPRMEIEDLGYNVETHGQKSYNGVAILSKTPLEDVTRGLPGDESDEQARYMEATVFGSLRVAAIYLPNGNPVPGEKFDYKLGWMDRLINRAQALLALEQPVVLGGDYNVIPRDVDVYEPAAFASDALTQPESRARFRQLHHLGYTNAFMDSHPQAAHQYSYWDYQGGAWQKGNGLLIDFLLLSPEAADKLTAAGINKDVRGKEKASDHAPVWCELDL